VNIDKNYEDLQKKIRCFEKPSNLGEIIQTRGEESDLFYLEECVGVKSALKTNAIVFVDPGADMKVTCTYNPKTSYEDKVTK